MEEMGQQPVHRELGDEEKIDAYKAKILEECNEGDLPDLLEVIEAWAEAEGMSFEELRRQQLEKRAKIGSFSTGTYISTLTLQDGDKWVDYYAAEPDRFPETTTNLRQQTVDTYNQSAKELSEYFQGIGSRVEHIDEALNMAGNVENPRILEIGCGDGRDAKEIVERTSSYVGFDISEGLIDYAKKNVPGAEFSAADATTFEYPENLDVVFAFASLLHLDKTEVTEVLSKVARSLRPGGIFYISLKYSSDYKSEIKEDQFGTRLFYFYNADIIAECGGDSYELVKNEVEHKGNTDWAEIALKRT